MEPRRARAAAVTPVLLLPASFRDRSYLLALRNHPEIVELGTSQMPATEQWLEGEILVVWKAVGYIRRDGEEVSIALERSARGQGIGTAALQAIRRPASAKIKPENEASIRAFKKAGFRHDGHTNSGLLCFTAE